MERHLTDNQNYHQRKQKQALSGCNSRFEGKAIYFQVARCKINFDPLPANLFARDFCIIFFLIRLI